jgi:hypothetical protein
MYVRLDISLVRVPLVGNRWFGTIEKVKNKSLYECSFITLPFSFEKKNRLVFPIKEILDLIFFLPRQKFVWKFLQFSSFTGTRLRFHIL